jgi:hypothetical protein
MKDRIKKFYRDHEEGVIIGAVIVLGTTANYVATSAAVKRYDIKSVDTNEDATHIRITMKNGKARYFEVLPK